MNVSIDLALNPYLALGLQKNPFIAEEAPGVPELLWVDRGWSQSPCCEAKQLVQVMGNKGFGKTSHLMNWQSQTGGPYCYYPLGWRRWKMPPVKKIAYWDEADRIPMLLFIAALIWAAFTGATIIIGTHTDRGKIAALLGLNVKSIYLPPLDVEELILWASCRIEAVRLPHIKCCLTLEREKAEEITAIAKGSWRIAADHLHIWAAELTKKLENI